jgi:hypothetical protein
MLTDPCFLGKNQISDRGVEPVIIPALPEYVLKFLTSKEIYSFCPKSGPQSKEIVLPIADLYPLLVEGTNCLISNK